MDRSKYDYCRGDALRLPKDVYIFCPKCGRRISWKRKNKTADRKKIEIGIVRY